MSWAKLDDLYDDNRKVKRAWKTARASIGLHAMAITYCARHELDGVVDLEWIEEKLPKAAERQRAIAALVDAGLFEVASSDGGLFRVHDYLVYNESKADADARRERDKERKRRGGSHGKPKDSARNPVASESPAGAFPTTSPSRPHPDPAAAALHPEFGPVSEILRAAIGAEVDVLDAALNSTLLANDGKRPHVEVAHEFCARVQSGQMRTGNHIGYLASLYRGGPKRPAGPVMDPPDPNLAELRDFRMRAEAEADRQKTTGGDGV